MSAQRPRVHVYALSVALVLSGCAHTKPIGQSLVALGALIVGLGTLDAAGVLGSNCTHARTPEGEAVDSCSGNGVTPHPDAVNILGIAFGAALIGGGVALWTTDSQSTPNQPPSSVSIVPTPRASTVVQPQP